MREKVIILISGIPMPEIRFTAVVSCIYANEKDGFTMMPTASPACSG